MEERKFKASEIEVLYNQPGDFYHLIRKEEKIDGNILFFEFDTGDQVDLGNYAIHGYKMLKDKGTIINLFKEYSMEELESMEESLGQVKLRKREIPKEFLVDLNWLMDMIEQNRYNYDVPYRVEQIEIRYSEVLQDFIFLYVAFDHVKKRLGYMDMATGRQLTDEVLELYSFYPRDEILKKETYTPRETIDLRVKLNQEARSLGRRM